MAIRIRDNSDRGRYGASVFRCTHAYIHYGLDEYANVEVIDLSVFPFAPSGEVADQLDAAEQIARDDTVQRAFKALRETGFLAIKGHGLSSQELHRQFDLGKMLFEEVTEEEKLSLHAKIWEGEWAGYKVTPLYAPPLLMPRKHSHADTTSDQMVGRTRMRCAMVLIGLFAALQKRT